MLSRRVLRTDRAGTHRDVIEHAYGLTKVRAIQPRIDGIVALTIVNSHTTIRLFGDCANKALSAPTTETFWASISAARASILSLTDHDNPSSPSRLQFKADRVTELPLTVVVWGHLNCGLGHSTRFGPLSMIRC